MGRFVCPGCCRCFLGCQANANETPPRSLGCFRMMVIKESRICFMFGEGGEVRDDIRLLDIEGVEQLDEGDALWQGGVDMAKKPSGKKKTDRRLAHQHSHVTLSEGDTHVRTSFCIHNTAQQHSHILRTETPEQRTKAMAAIESAIERAVNKAVEQHAQTPIEVARYHIAKIMDGSMVQKFIGFILFINFAINIVEAEMQSVEDADSLLSVLDTMDLVFTAIYCIELACNLFIKWWRPFLQDPWSVFDAICVLAGVVSNILAAQGSGSSGLSIIRSVRIFKIVRIFSRLSELQRIMASISATLGPLFYTFLIYVVVNSIYAVLATQFYADLDPLQFGSFSKAWLSMVQVSTGDGWATDVLRPLLAAGEHTSDHFQWMTGCFFVVYIFMVHLVLLNVAVAVLLEGFLTALTDFQGMDRAAEGQEEYKKLSKCLDPIISTLANFHSEEHLGYMINRFFEYLDVDDNGYVSYAEMKKGMEKLDIQPKIKFSAEDFDEFTRDHEYTEEDGNVSRDNFEKCMRLELKGYAFRIAAHQMNQAVKEGENSNDYMYNKIVMREVFDVSKRLSELEMRESRARGEREGIEMSNTPMLSPAAATRSALSFGSPVPTPKASPPATEPVTCRCGGGATCCFQAVVDQMSATEGKGAFAMVTRCPHGQGHWGVNGRDGIFVMWRREGAIMREWEGAESKRATM
eukprot:Tamp_02738.p1 GENE.Tamp_02738~~Tamp_02738.p1  ORF type:complete len:690 (-),score=97.12 Tamp_02738:1216-3285(-)